MVHLFSVAHPRSWHVPGLPINSAISQTCIDRLCHSDRAQRSLIAQIWTADGYNLERGRCLGEMSAIFRQSLSLSFRFFTLPLPYMIWHYGYTTRATPFDILINIKVLQYWLTLWRIQSPHSPCGHHVGCIVINSAMSYYPASISMHPSTPEDYWLLVGTTLPTVSYGIHKVTTEFWAFPDVRDHAYTDLSISQSFVLSFLRADIHQSQAVTTLCRLKVDAVVPTCSK
jgi:hypothetical protein